MRAQQLTPVVVGHGEGPVWWPSDGLRICDGDAGAIVSLADDGTVTNRLTVGTFVGAFRPRADGGLVASAARSFVLVDPDGTVRPGKELWTDETVRMNDGGCDPQGRFYCGSMFHQGGRPVGSLYRLAPDGSTTVVLTGLGCPNGMVYTADGRTVYYIDTDQRRIDAFDVDEDGQWRDRRPVAADLGDGAPDGMTIDVDGRLWVAMWGGAQVCCVDPDSGRVVERLDVPGAMQTSACTFGGPELDRLFITTSTVNGRGGPLGGAVFVAEPGARGVLPLTFAG